MSFFSGIKTSDNIQESGDHVGRTHLDTGVYDAVIKLAYAHESQGGAKAISYIFDINNQEHEETLYFTTNKAKGQKVYYESNGEKRYLAGYTHNNDISLLTAGKEFTQLEMEDKIVEIYNKETKNKQETKVKAFTGLHGKAIKLGLFKELSEYNDKIYTKNVINKVFSAKHDKTVAECKAKKETAEFINQWKEKYSKDYISDKTNGKASTTSESSTAVTTDDDIAF